MKLKVIVIALIVAFVSSCGSDGKKEEKISKPAEEKKVVEVGPMEDKGIGPITSVALAEINESMVAEGKELFKLKCSACHKISKRFVGPALAGVTERRTPEWIMNMILNPEVMVAENPIDKDLGL